MTRVRIVYFTETSDIAVLNKLDLDHILNYLKLFIIVVT